MDYKKTAEEIYRLLGGKENLVSAAHCATRLRIVLADTKKCDNDAIENVDGVKGTFFASGQLQVILGTGVVNKVYDEFIKIAGISEATKEEVKQVAAEKTNWFQKAIKTIGDIFVPIIPAIVASGFLMGIMEALNFMVNNGFIQIDTSSSIYVFAQLFSNVAYTFLPILIGFSAAKVFGGNPFLGAVIGMIMIHPDLQNAWTVASEGVQKTQEVFFGLYSIDMVGYQGHVIPIMISVWVMSFLEKKLHKYVPAMLDLFVTPLVSVFVAGYLALAVIGPVFVVIENAIINGVQWLIAIPFGIGSFIMGGLYATTVVSGIHHMYTVIDIGQLAQYGLTFWLPLASAANVGQGGAALAVAFRSKNKKTKSVALPAALSACMGITEPAIFGINLRFLKPFIAGSIGGACGALYASIVHLGATGTGVTGIFGILLHLHSPVHYIITVLIAFVVAFVVAWILGIKEDVKEEKEPAPSATTVSSGTVASSATAESANVSSAEPNTVYSPLDGESVPLSSVNDQTFASGILGNGVAVKPSAGRVVAPFSGEVSTLFDTKHAIGLTGDDGVELLIHVGLNTVELGGRYYDAKVKMGDRVERGQTLIEFDKDEIEKAGYETVTPVIISNIDSYKSMDETLGGVKFGDVLIKLSKE
ncbi:MAG TPA: sucrose-specific PTS transporter subunit IIBC [Firmicutes bacterium]|nr:sucrose-specific PTS transporter subunit IIBC [Bacillota bacterium]